MGMAAGVSPGLVRHTWTHCTERLLACRGLAAYYWSMSGHEAFEAELEERLRQRRTELEEQDLPTIKQHFRRMQSSFEAIHNVLRKKGLLKQDPYNYEERLSELTIPSDAPYTDAERDTQLSVRMGQYETRLSYVSEYFDFSLDNLDLRNLKLVVKFVNYINWRNVSDTATQPTTRGLGEQLAKIRRGTDTLSTNIVTDAQDQLSNASRSILSVLKRVSGYQRELYKLEVRREVLSDPSVPTQPGSDEYDKAARAVKAVFPRLMPGKPFARDLVLEIFAENDPANGETIRQTLLHELSPRKQEKKPSKTESDIRELLLDAIRTLAGISRSIEESARILGDNALVLEARKLSFGEMLRQIWDRMRGADGEQRVYTLEFVDPTTNSRKVEDLNFDEFVTGLTRRARIYNGILARTGPGWSKLQESDEDRLLQFVTKDTHEVMTMAQRLEALDTYFRTEVPREQRSQLRSINTQLTTINETIVRSRKKTRQYVAKVEEREQLRKLGIDA